MLWNYIRISFRKFTRQKFYSLLNIFGLATGMATVLLILLFVLDEWSFDRFHIHAKDLYRVVENQYYSDEPAFPVAVTPGPLAQSLKDEFAEVKLATRVKNTGAFFRYKEAGIMDKGIYADPEFLKIFSFTLKSGKIENVLADINSVVLTESLAEKLLKNLFL